MAATYYTPKIEEFHVGFEFECHIDNGLVNKSHYKEGQEWKSTVWQVGDFFTSDKPTGIRVKHLDREDIESLGWTFNSEHNNSFYIDVDISVIKGELNLIKYEKARYYLHLCNDFVLIYTYVKFDDKFCIDPPYKFFIKNKSELKRLMRQLGITE